jgi:hypothetical protein
MESYLTIEPFKPYFIESDCFRQASKPDQNNYVIWEWKQLAKCHFYGFYFKHDFDVTFFSKNSAVKFRVDTQDVTLTRGANLTIPANTKYSFYGLEHCHNEMLCMAPITARENWESVAQAMLTAQNLTRVR